MTPEQISLAQQILRIRVEEMNEHELNIGLAVLMDFNTKVENNIVYIEKNSQFVEYNPMKNWEQFGHIMSNQPIVVGSHNKYDNNGKKEGYWYSCHAFYGGTEINGYDYKKTIAQSCIKLLEHLIKYPPDDE